MEDLSFDHLLLQEFLDDGEVEAVLHELEDEDTLKPKRIGRIYIRRDFVVAHDQLMADYFTENPRYSEKMFERRFRMSKVMFMEIVQELERKSDFFKLRADALGKPGLSSIQKCCAAVRMLAYGTAADSVDEYLKMGDSTAMMCLKQFCRVLVAAFGDRYLRSPNADDLQRLLSENEARGFPGMLGSIDCWHWQWENCPTAYKGQFTGKDGKSTVVLEAIASYDTHIWHSFFGSPGSLNDINILDRSPILNNIVNGGILKACYVLNGKPRDQGYFLADGIYPDWGIFVKTISHPKNAKEKLFSKAQESLRKDVERAFGILQKCWHILAHPVRLGDLTVLKEVMDACIVLHNMRIEYRIDNDILDHYEAQDNEPQATLQNTFESYCAKRAKLRNPTEHFDLRNDLIEHLWQHQGNMMA